MSDRKRNTIAIKLLSLVLAVCIWLFVAGERTVERTLRVPLRLVNCPPGLRIAGTVPGDVEVVISGPRLLAVGLRPERLGISLDLAGARPGATVFPRLEEVTGLPDHFRVTRVSPPHLEVVLATAEGHGAP